MLFCRSRLFSRARTRMTCDLVTRLQGRNDAFSPYQAGSSVSCLVYHFLPALDGFGHESPRKCAETPRRYRAHPQKTENRPACGYRTVFCSIGIMGMAYFQSASLHLHYTTNGGKSRAFFHESSKNGSKCLLPGGIAAENARQRKKGLLHSAVRQPPV